MFFGLNLLSTTAETPTEINFDWSGLLNLVVEWLTTTGIKLVIAILLLIISFKFTSFFCKRLYKRLQKRNVDETIARVGSQALNWTCKIVILVCLIGYVGIETASISAVIASLGVGISLAVQGTLSNLAGGIIIIVMRPFKIGDYIKGCGEEGTVEDIKLFYTHIVTPDNKVVMIPNGSLANDVMVNFSAKESRRCDVTFGVSYDTDTALAKNLIKEVCDKNELIFKDPSVFIDIVEFGDSSINIVVRAWCKNGDYWAVYFYLMNEIKAKFDENKIEIPFNTVDVNVKPVQKDGE